MWRGRRAPTRCAGRAARRGSGDRTSADTVRYAGANHDRGGARRRCPWRGPIWWVRIGIGGPIRGVLCPWRGPMRRGAQAILALKASITASGSTFHQNQWPIRRGAQTGSRGRAAAGAKRRRGGKRASERGEWREREGKGVKAQPPPPPCPHRPYKKHPRAPLRTPPYPSVPLHIPPEPTGPFRLAVTGDRQAALEDWQSRS